MKFIFILIPLIILSAYSEIKMPEKLNRNCALHLTIYGNHELRDSSLGFLNEATGKTLTATLNNKTR